MMTVRTTMGVWVVRVTERMMSRLISFSSAAARNTAVGSHALDASTLQFPLGNPDPESAGRKGFAGGGRVRGGDSV